MQREEVDEAHRFHGLAIQYSYERDDSQNYDAAITDAEVGLFNILLLTATFACGVAMILCSTSIAYIMPSAECDLQLTLKDKGLLNLSAYSGMITSSLFWAIVSDTKGRKLVIICSHLSNAFFVFSSSFSQNFMQLFIFQFFAGFCICGGFSSMMTYISELHNRKHRFHVILIVGMMLSVNTFTLPALAIAILPYRWKYNLLGLKYYSWNLFLAVSTIPSCICGFLFFFFPESPRFDITQNRYDKALASLQYIFHLNTRKPKTDYPIKELSKRKFNIDDSNIASIIKKGYRQIVPLFTRRYILLLLVVCFMELSILTCQNTMRLWTPNIFVLFNQYETETTEKHKRLTFCTILDYAVNKSAYVSNNTLCYVNITGASYMYNFIVGISSILAYILAHITLYFIEANIILSLSLIISVFAILTWLLTTTSLSFTILVSIYLGMENIASSSLVNASVTYFPTEMKNTVLSLIFLIGRIGSVMGNFGMPYLIQAGCLAIVLTGAIINVCSFIVSILLPNPSLIAFI